MQDLRREKRGEMWGFSGDMVVFCDDALLGSCEALAMWAAENWGFEDTRPLAFYEALARDAYNLHISKKESAFVFMDVCIEGELIGKLVFELYRHLCPITCNNFIALCTGEKGVSSSGVKLSYVNSLFHRIVRGGWIQGGDICGGSGAQGESIYGLTFDDESFAVSHDTDGIIGMANHGPDTNNSQFYITLKPAPWMNKIYVAFGRVVEGSSVLERLGSVKTYNERPKDLCQVSNCGLLPLI